MNLIKTLAAGVVALSAMSTASFAADVIMPVMPAPIVVPPVVPQPTWTGAYFGIVGGFTFAARCDGDCQQHPNWKNLGVVGGYDVQLGTRFVAGVNVRTTIPSVGMPLFQGQLDAIMNGRAGVLLGDRLLAYGTGGIGVMIGGHTGVFPYMAIGAGVEFAFNERVHMFGEVSHLRGLGGFGPIGNSITIGLTLR